MKFKLILAAAGLALIPVACFPDAGTGGGGTTTPSTVVPTSTTSTTTSTTTTTTTAPLPTLEYTGVADKTAGCYSGLATGNDRFQVVLGTDGWWDFGFQGCSLGATETVALIDPAGGPTGDAFQAPTDYQCKFEILGTSDATGYLTNQVGTGPDTGGKIFLTSTSSWASPTTWKITCIQAGPVAT